MNPLDDWPPANINPPKGTEWWIKEIEQMRQTINDLREELLIEKIKNRNREWESWENECRE